MGLLSGEHPAQANEGEGKGDGPQVEEKEDPKSLLQRGGPLPSLWSLRWLFDTGGLR